MPVRARHLTVSDGRCTHRADRRGRADAARAAEGAARRGVARARDRRRGGERRGGAGARRAARPDIAFLDIRMPVRSGIDVARELGRQCARRVRHRVRRVRGRRVRRRRGRLRAEAGRRRSGSPRSSPALKARLATPPRDLTALLARLAARDGTRPPLKWIRASLGATMQMIAVDDVALLPGRGQVHQGRHRRRRSADQEADQGALRGARPRSVLADPSRHDRQPARDRARSSATGATSR